MTSKQRAYLRSLANTMEPILHIGKEGVTQGVAQQAWTRWRRGSSSR